MFIAESYIFIGATEPQQSHTHQKKSLYATFFKFDCAPSFDCIIS